MSRYSDLIRQVDDIYTASEKAHAEALQFAQTVLDGLVEYLCVNPEQLHLVRTPVDRGRALLSTSPPKLVECLKLEENGFWSFTIALDLTGQQLLNSKRVVAVRIDFVQREGSEKSYFDVYLRDGGGATHLTTPQESDFLFFYGRLCQAILTAHRERILLLRTDGLVKA